MVKVISDKVSSLQLYPECKSVSSVYGKLGYRDIVQRAANVSMMSAVFDVKALPEYTTNKGEVCFCTVLLE